MIAVGAALALLAQADIDFPLRPGARWVYVQDGREAMILDAVEASPTTTLRIRGGSFFWMSDDAFLSIGDQGLRCHGYSYQDSLFPKDPPRLLLPPRLEKGMTWEAEKLWAEVVDVEDVKVPAGSFRAWRIDYEIRHHLGTELDFRAWYAPGTGFVRFDYWQTSTMGSKTPLEKPWRRELARFEPKRKVTPLAIPPLSPEARRAAEDLLGRMSTPDVGIREKAADDLFALGRSVEPLLRDAIGRASDPEVEARLRQVVERFPKLEFTARLLREKGKVGEPLPVGFALRNLAPASVQILPSLDGSAVGRSPRYLLSILDEQGVAQQPDRIPFCGHVNRLLRRDFVTLESGEEFDPLGPGSFGHYLLRWAPSRPGIYTLDAVYDATGKVPEAWQGSGAMDPAALKMLEAMPRGRYEAKRLTIVVEP